MINVKVFENAPKAAGVYLFKKAGVPLYIGKAANLKKRLSSYWRKNAAQKIENMLREATKLEWIETESEIEALLKEAELIKKHQPKYNHLLRDDKNYFYVGFTKEKFPRIFITHQPAGLQTTNYKLQTDYIGPFTSGAALKETLRLLRRVFPYCTCKTPHKRLCLNAQIGRCPGFCCLKSNMHLNKRPLDKMYIWEYRTNIRNVQAVLMGNKTKILSVLRREMRYAAKKQDFEQATKLRDQIMGLENIFRHSTLLEVKPLQYSDVLRWNEVKKVLQSVLGAGGQISRVEGYDISNISGTEATGSMVVFIDGKPAKSEYRKFRIKTVHGANDVAMLKEVIRRRLKHAEWPYPNVMLIDGGKPQLNAVLSIVKPIIHNSKFIIHVVALAKREEELYTEKRTLPIRLNMLPRETALFLQRVRDESHRFAKKYHHKLREIFYRKK